MTDELVIESWPACQDACANLWWVAAREWGLPVQPYDQILEIGCAEHDWAALVKARWPLTRLWGLDQRAAEASHDVIQRRDVLTAEFEPASFDWIVLISALEHIGLGHYGDPVDVDGDTHCLERAWRWLRPGGSLYFDVPYRADGYSVEGTSYRIYDGPTLERRLRDPMGWSVMRQGWREGGHLICRLTPLEPEPDPGNPHAFVEVVCWWHKPDA